MNFNKDEFKRFREEIKKAVASVEKDFGVEIEFGNISYTQNDFTIKTTVHNGSLEDSKKNEFLKYAGIYGFNESDLGKEFIFKGKKTWIIGFEPTRRKYPVLVEDESGTQFLITIDGAKKALSK